MSRLPSPLAFTGRYTTKTKKTQWKISQPGDVFSPRTRWRYRFHWLCYRPRGVSIYFDQILRRLVWKGALSNILTNWKAFKYNEPWREQRLNLGTKSQQELQGSISEEKEKWKYQVINDIKIALACRLFELLPEVLNSQKMANLQNIVRHLWNNDFC